MTPWGQGPLVVRRLASTFGPGNAPLAAGVGFQWEAVSVPPATPALAEGSREGRGLSRDLGSPCPSSPPARPARSRQPDWLLPMLLRRGCHRQAPRHRPGELLLGRVAGGSLSCCPPPT